MTHETKNRPIENIRDGAIKAAIWKNESDNGTFFSVTFERTYTDAKTGEVKSTNSFSGSELLRVARLAGKVYDRTSKLAKAAKLTDQSEGA